MKPLPVMIIAILVGIYLSGCRSHVPTPIQPSIAAGSLDIAEAYLVRGDQCSAIKDYEHAIADYSQAIRLQPDYAEAHNNRGFAYAVSGKLGMAKTIADYSRAIRLRPTDAHAYNNRGVAYISTFRKLVNIQTWRVRFQTVDCAVLAQVSSDSCICSMHELSKE